jgi:hypothetical protein
MNPERPSGNGVMTADLIRDYMGWWAYLTVMGGLAPALGGFTPSVGLPALTDRLDGEQPVRLMPSEFMREVFADLTQPRDTLVG